MARAFVTVAFPTDRRATQKQPKHVRICLREFKHDTAILTMELESKSKLKYRSGSPLSITWGWRPDDVDYFHGYVHHTKQIFRSKNRLVLEVYCVGASYRMKQVRVRSFIRKTASQVAMQIAREHRFSITTSLHSYRHETLAQAGRSDWDFLVWLAKRSGFSMYCNKTNIVFQRRLIDKASRARPTFVFTPGITRQRGGIYRADDLDGEAVPGTENRTRVVSGVAADGTVIKRISKRLADTGGTKQLNAPVFGRVLRGRPVHTAAAADALANGEASLHRFSIRGDFVLSGNTKVRQGTTVRMLGLDDDSNGLWYVTDIDHVITLGEYKMHALAGRDQLGDAAEDTPTSDNGDQVVITDCDVSVDSMLDTPPESIYDPVDDCVPIEAAAAALDDVTLPFSLDPVVQNRIDKIGLSKYRRAAPRPTTSRGVAPTTGTRLAVKPPKITGWRAKTTRVRVLR